MKNPAGAGLRWWRSIAIVAIEIDDSLSLQRDSLAPPVEQALDQAGDRPPIYDYLLDFT